MLSLIVRFSDKRLVSSNPDSVRKFINQMLKDEHLSDAISGFSKRFLPDRPNAVDWLKWLQAGDDTTPFGLISRPRGKPSNERMRPVQRFLSTLVKLQKREADTFADLEARIAASRDELVKVRMELDVEEAFSKASVLYLIMESLTQSGSKALSMGPLLTVAEAIYEHYGYDVMALVLREMVGNAEFKRELAERIHDLCLTHYDTADDMLRARVAAGSAEAAVAVDASQYDAAAFEELFSGRRVPKV